MKLLDTTEHLYAPATAETVAAALQAGEEEGWTYRVVHDPTGRGYSYIAIYDDDGEMIGKY